MFAHTVAAGHIRTFVDDVIPKSCHNFPQRSVAGDFILTRQADEFWKLRVRVQSVQRILALKKRTQHRVMSETFSEREVIRFARRRVKVHQQFLHAAVFDLEHGLHLLVV